MTTQSGTVMNQQPECLCGLSTSKTGQRTDIFCPRHDVHLSDIERAIHTLVVKDIPAYSHSWKYTGRTITTFPEFDVMRCTACGAVNWDGKMDGVCSKSGGVADAIESPA